MKKSILLFSLILILSSCGEMKETTAPMQFEIIKCSFGESERADFAIAQLQESINEVNVAKRHGMDYASAEALISKMEDQQVYYRDQTLHEYLNGSNP